MICDKSKTPLRNTASNIGASISISQSRIEVTENPVLNNPLAHLKCVDGVSHSPKPLDTTNAREKQLDFVLAKYKWLFTHCYKEKNHHFAATSSVPFSALTAHTGLTRPQLEPLLIELFERGSLITYSDARWRKSNPNKTRKRCNRAHGATVKGIGNLKNNNVLLVPSNMEQAL